MDGFSISDREFSQFRELLERMTGIHLSAAKKPLLCGRLSKRLRQLQLDSYGAYYALITSGRHDDELETAVNLLTTNETYFFREERHFDFLQREVLAQWPAGRAFRAWSAACSSGDEAYTLAMVLADALGEGASWEVFASDVSTDILRKARKGQYPLSRGRQIPPDLLRRYCLRGVGSRAGDFMVSPQLRRRVSFAQVNLKATLPRVGDFDVVFLRNVLIYFEPGTKREVVERVSERIRPGGWLVIGHSESLNGITEAVRPVAPTIYRKPASA